MVNAPGQAAAWMRADRAHGADPLADGLAAPVDGPGVPAEPDDPPALAFGVAGQLVGGAAGLAGGVGLSARCLCFSFW